MMMMFSPPLSPPLRTRGGVNCKKNNNTKKNRRFATANNASSSSSSEIDGTKSVIKKIARKLQSGELTSLRVTEMYLERMKDSSLNCYASVNEEDALERAAEMDRERMNDERGEKKRSLLHGIPIAVKDNICTKNIYTTAGSKILREYRPDFDADVVKHLNKEGVVVLGKTNMDEFGMGSTTESSAYAPTSNPWDESRVPG